MVGIGVGGFGEAPASWAGCGVVLGACAPFSPDEEHAAMTTKAPKRTRIPRGWHRWSQFPTAKMRAEKLSSRSLASEKLCVPRRYCALKMTLLSRVMLAPPG